MADPYIIDAAPCVICGLGEPDRVGVGVYPHHVPCATCQNCGDDFVAWRYLPPRPTILRCLNCLHRWEGVSVDAEQMIDAALDLNLKVATNEGGKVDSAEGDASPKGDTWAHGDAIDMDWDLGGHHAAGGDVEHLRIGDFCHAALEFWRNITPSKGSHLSQMSLGPIGKRANSGGLARAPEAHPLLQLHSDLLQPDLMALDDEGEVVPVLDVQGIRDVLGQDHPHVLVHPAGVYLGAIGHGHASPTFPYV